MNFDRNFIQEINVINNEYYYIPCPYSHITKRILTNLNFSHKKSDNILLKSDIKKIIALYSRTRIKQSQEKVLNIFTI